MSYAPLIGDFFLSGLTLSTHLFKQSPNFFTMLMGIISLPSSRMWLIVTDTLKLWPLNWWIVQIDFCLLKQSVLLSPGLDNNVVLQLMITIVAYFYCLSNVLDFSEYLLLFFPYSTTVHVVYFTLKISFTNDIILYWWAFFLTVWHSFLK